MPAKSRKKEYSKRRFTRVEQKLAALQEFEKNILPSLRSALIDKSKSASEILEDHKAYAAARLVSIIATEQDSGRALAALKDLLDRTEGKAVERFEQTHKFEKLNEDQLDALLISKLKDAELPKLPTLQGSTDEEDDEDGV